jgi:hypothetical protein
MCKALSSNYSTIKKKKEKEKEKPAIAAKIGKNLKFQS